VISSCELAECFDFDTGFTTDFCEQKCKQITTTDQRREYSNSTFGSLNLSKNRWVGTVWFIRLLTLHSETTSK